ncbi:NAD(P)-binding protein [Trichodelitschia bisporula]|uniref:NAD(P)-binding protein n=1 Tax=Trichodelitschia bisporula TaxID=703511 RepID=A0A6G1HKA1_9PEZI|nr:NAD(P)-binding protein [Trichodelitschia bisporula]
MTKLAGTNILVIGGTSGIGNAVASLALAEGANVQISSSKASRVESAVADLRTAHPSATVAGHVVDLSNEDTLEDNVAGLLAAVGPLNHIVFTAGDSLPVYELKDITPALYHKAHTVRVVAPLMVAKHAAKILPPSPRSSITLTTGSIASKPIPNWTVVSSLAAAAQGVTRNLAVDMKPIRVNIVAPGVVYTPLWDSWPKEVVETMLEQAKAKTTTGETGKVEDVAEAYLYLMKDSNVSGVNIDTNSGVFLV